MLGILPAVHYFSGMKESYHICFTSHNEVMFRDEEDHGMFVNLMALRVFASEADLLADAEMSTHVHLNALISEPMSFASRLRMCYTKYFNAKYGREGRFGEKFTFLQRVEGFNHQLVVMNYIDRNGLHHAAAATALGYPYSSVRSMFARDIGLAEDPPVPMSRQDIAAWLPRRSEFPDTFQMNAKGVFVRSSFMELRQAEYFYGSPRNFLYQMNRLTDETWERGQLEDNTGKPIRLQDLEPADERSIAQMLKNEYGKNFNPNTLQDMDVCRLIDRDLLPSYGVTSVYQLTPSQKRRIARQLLNEFRLPEHQIRRCLVL